MFINSNDKILLLMKLQQTIPIRDKIVNEYSPVRDEREYFLSQFNQPTHANRRFRDFGNGILSKNWLIGVF